PPSSTLFPYTTLFRSLLGGSAWLAGVWVITAPREVSDQTPVNPREEWKRLRWVNRATQACWLLGAIATVAAERAAPIAPAFRTRSEEHMSELQSRENL